jgi:hypothetical protein
MSDDAGDGGAKTFTQADVDRIVRDRLERERAKYADYDDLKAKAAEADKSKSQLDRIEAKLAESEKRADQLTRDGLIRDVAEELGVSVKVARKFEGKTRDELLADGRETLRDMGIEPDKSKRKKTTDDKGSEGGDAGGTDDADDDTDEGREGDTDADEQRTGSTRETEQRETRRRPRELRSGAAMSPGGREERDPMKLIAGVPRG